MVAVGRGWVAGGGRDSCGWMGGGLGFGAEAAGAKRAVGPAVNLGTVCRGAAASGEGRARAEGGGARGRVVGADEDDARVLGRQWEGGGEGRRATEAPPTPTSDAVRREGPWCMPFALGCMGCMGCMGMSCVSCMDCKGCCAAWL